MSSQCRDSQPNTRHVDCLPPHREMLPTVRNQTRRLPTAWGSIHHGDKVINTTVARS